MLKYAWMLFFVLIVHIYALPNDLSSLRRFLRERPDSKDFQCNQEVKCNDKYDKHGNKKVKPYTPRTWPKYQYTELFRDHVYREMSPSTKEVYVAVGIHPSCVAKKGQCIRRDKCIGKKMYYLSRVCYKHDLVCCYEDYPPTNYEHAIIRQKEEVRVTTTEKSEDKKEDEGKDEEKKEDEEKEEGKEEEDKKDEEKKEEEKKEGEEEKKEGEDEKKEGEDEKKEGENKEEEKKEGEEKEGEEKKEKRKRRLRKLRRSGNFMQRKDIHLEKEGDKEGNMEMEKVSSEPDLTLENSPTTEINTTIAAIFLPKDNKTNQTSWWLVHGITKQEILSKLNPSIKVNEVDFSKVLADFPEMTAYLDNTPPQTDTSVSKDKKKTENLTVESTKEPKPI